MARSYIRNMSGGTIAIIANLSTIGGGRTVTIYNPHATESIVIGGDENIAGSANPGATALSATTGMVVKAGKYVSLTLEGSNEAIYGMSVTGTQTITINVFRSNYPAPHNFG